MTIWLISKRAFDSVVAYDPSKDRDKIFVHIADSRDTHLLVRGRTREDLEDLAIAIPGVVVSDRPVADYDFGAVVSREDFKAYLNKLVDEIDYDSHFKEVVRANASKPEIRYPAMMAIWSQLYKLQPTRSYTTVKTKTDEKPTFVFSDYNFDDVDWGYLATLPPGETEEDFYIDVEQLITMLALANSLLDFTTEERQSMTDDAYELYVRLQETHGITAKPTPEQIQEARSDLRGESPPPQEGSTNE